MHQLTNSIAPFFCTSSFHRALRVVLEVLVHHGRCSTLVDVGWGVFLVSRDFTSMRPTTRQRIAARTGVRTEKRAITCRLLLQEENRSRTRAQRAPAHLALWNTLGEFVWCVTTFCWLTQSWCLFELCSGFPFCLVRSSKANTYCF